MTDAILNITDGTTTISLINPSSGFHLINWVPAITDYKGGGVFQDPPLADWRQLRVAKWATATENFGLTINGQNPNGVAYMLQELRRLLEKANAYWTTDWQNTPVYLEARAKCETNTRYCLVVKGRLANDQNYYRQPFTGIRTTMRDLPLVIERRAWQDLAPGSKTSVSLSNQVDYNSVTYGRGATTANEIYHANKRSVANITNIHITTAGANIQNASLPRAITNVSGANPTYFGISTSVTDSGPFDSLIFDIGTAQVGATIVWEYWNGAWTSIGSSLRDDTNQFKNTGVNSVAWIQPSDWVAASPGGALPSGYYVRARVTATGSVNATQQNRNIYSQTVPYVEVGNAQIPGDIPALVQLTVANMLYQGVISTDQLKKIIFGLRSTSRGVSAFTPYINISDEQNPTGISISAGNGTFTTATQYPTGRVSVLTVGGAGSATQNLAIVTLDNTISTEFYGRYRAYIRTGAITGFSAIQAKIQVLDASATGVLFDSGYYSVPINNTDFTVVDLGQLSILPEATRTDPGDVILRVRFDYTATGATSITLIDIIIIPIDEWSAEFIAPDDLFSNLIDADSLRQKKVIETLSRDLSTNERKGVVRSIQNGPNILQANTTQRIYSFAQDEISASGNYLGQSALLKRGVVWKLSRYLSLRGNR